MDTIGGKGSQGGSVRSKVKAIDTRNEGPLAKVSPYATPAKSAKIAPTSTVGKIKAGIATVRKDPANADLGDAGLSSRLQKKHELSSSESTSKRVQQILLRIADPEAKGAFKTELELAEAVIILKALIAQDVNKDVLANIRALGAQGAEMIARIAAMTKEHDAAMRRLQAENERLLELTEGQREEIRAQKDEIRELKAKIEDLEGRERANAAALRGGADPASKLKKSEDKVSSLQARNAELETALQDARSAASGKGDLLETIAGLREELGQKKLAEDAQLAKIAQLEEELTKEKENAADLAKKLEAASKANTALTTVVEELTAQLAAQAALAGKTDSEQLQAAKQELEVLRRQLATATAALAAAPKEQPNPELLERFHRQFEAFEKWSRARPEPAVAVAPPEKVRADASTSTDEVLPQPEVKPAKRPARPPLVLSSFDFRTAAPAVASDRSRALDLESSAAIPAARPPKREPGLGFDIGALDFETLFSEATSESFKENKDGTSEGNRKAIFKSFVSALNKYLGSDADQQELTKADVEAMNAVEKNSYAQSLSPKTQGIDFVTAMQNSQFAAKFMEWANIEAQAIKATSGQYGAASPHSSPQSPFVSEQVAAMEQNLASIRQKSGQGRA